MNRDDYINRMETLISYPDKFEKVSVPKNKDYSFMVKEKSLFDNILDTLYENNAISCDIKIMQWFRWQLDTYGTLRKNKKIHCVFVFI